MVGFRAGHSVPDKAPNPPRQSETNFLPPSSPRTPHHPSTDRRNSLHRRCFPSSGKSGPKPSQTPPNTFFSPLLRVFQICRSVFYDRSFFAFKFRSTTATRKGRLPTTSRSGREAPVSLILRNPYPTPQNGFNFFSPAKAGTIAHPPLPSPIEQSFLKSHYIFSLGSAIRLALCKGVVPDISLNSSTPGASRSELNLFAGHGSHSLDCILPLRAQTKKNCRSVPVHPRLINFQASGQCRRPWPKEPQACGGKPSRPRARK